MDVKVENKLPPSTMAAAASHPPTPINPRREQISQSIVKLSPRYDGSIIYDSYELRAMTNQVNRAIHGLRLSSPHPAFVRNKACIYGPGAACREYIGKLWKKATRLLVRNMQRNNTS